MMNFKLYQGVLSFCCYKPVEMLGVNKGFCCNGCKKEIYSWMDEDLISRKKDLKIEDK